MYRKLLIPTISVIFLITSIIFAQEAPPDSVGEVFTDSRSGLTWQKCSLGQSSNSTCSVTATTLTWSNAISYCDNLALRDGKIWRVPQINELKTLVDSTKTSEPTLNSANFPSNPIGNYWSSTSHPNGATTAFFVNFSNGSVGNATKGNFYYVRCILGQ